MEDKEDKYDYYADDIKYSAKFPFPSPFFPLLFIIYSPKISQSNNTAERSENPISVPPFAFEFSNVLFLKRHAEGDYRCWHLSNEKWKVALA